MPASFHFELVLKGRIRRCDGFLRSPGPLQFSKQSRPSDLDVFHAVEFSRTGGCAANGTKKPLTRAEASARSRKVCPASPEGLQIVSSAGTRSRRPFGQPEDDSRISRVVETN